MLNKFRNNDKGFTLVELMMVIVILGVLAGVAVPMVGNMRKNALRAKLGSYADSLGTAILMESMANPEFELDTADWESLISIQGDNVIIAYDKVKVKVGDDDDGVDGIDDEDLILIVTEETDAGFEITGYSGIGYKKVPPEELLEPKEFLWAE
jgi:prepilin-type N-terminal cleavage/methylation domain-containing protein